MMNRKLLAIQSSDSNKVAFLENQVNARLNSTSKVEYTGFPAKYYCKQGKNKIKKTSGDKAVKPLQYLTELLILMINFEVDHPPSSSTTTESTASLYRDTPNWGEENSSSEMHGHVAVGKAEANKMEVEEDTEFLQFEWMKNKVLYDKDVSKFFYILEIEYANSGKRSGFVAATVECDMNGVKAKESLTRYGDVIDSKTEYFNLDGEIADGDTVEDMINACGKERDNPTRDVVNDSSTKKNKKNKKK